jgi:hypothetical protein
MEKSTFMNQGGPRAEGQEVKPSEKSARSITQYVSDLMRLDIIRQFFLGKEPLSRGTRESHFVEAWFYAVSKDYLPTDPRDPGYVPRIRLKESIGFVLRMRELSPHEGGKHIEVLRDLLATQPNNITLVGSPYDVPPEGPFDIIGKISGRHQDDRVRYRK